MDSYCLAIHVRQPPDPIAGSFIWQRNELGFDLGTYIQATLTAPFPKASTERES
jgi:hypothetical protein